MAKLISYDDKHEEFKCRTLTFKASAKESDSIILSKEFVLVPKENDIRIDVIERGETKGTQYLKIPLTLRRNLKLKPNNPLNATMHKVGKKKYLLVELN